ncbi:MAG: sulfatase-like hydrolase/transferase [Bacteroidales bacterium]|nr:sulfatase-like hydrolase/transferase [Bacteroidales bacterium]
MKQLLFILLAIPFVVFSQNRNSANVIFILVDDQGWNSLSIPMDPKIEGSKSDFYQTPNIDKMAKEGMRFPQGYSPAPLCAPSRNSIEFGVSPAKTHITSNMRPNPKEYGRFTDTDKSIGNLIKDANSRYITGYFGKWHASKPITQCGYDYTGVKGGNSYGNTSTDVNDPKRTFEITDASMDFITDRVKSSEPFFLTMSYYANHLDFKSSVQMYDKYEKLPKGEQHNDIDYAGMNEDLDKAVGMLLSKLKELGIEDNTYIFYTADNGYDEGPTENHINGNPVRKAWPLSYSKGFVTEGGFRVPFIVKGPGIKSNTICREPVVGYDLMPTFLNIVNPQYTIPVEKEGGSLLPVLKNKGKGVISRKNDFIVAHAPNSVWTGLSALIQGDYKIVMCWAKDTCALFNLKEDISEQHDIADRYPEKRDEMQSLLFEYLKSVESPPVPEARMRIDLEGVYMKKKGGVYNIKKKKKK